MSHDFSFFIEPPALNAEAILSIEALAPLSMVAAQPGNYFRSQPAPTEQMLYGLLENAMGWHFENDRKGEPLDRKRLLRHLRDEVPVSVRNAAEWKGSDWLTEKLPRSPNAFFSLLKYHLVFSVRQIPRTTHFDDLWARLARRGDDFIGGSRNYDSRMEQLVEMVRQGRIKLGTKGKSDIKEAHEVPEQIKDGVSVYQGALKSKFPEYYFSPTPREYVLPEGRYVYRVETTARLAALISASIENPSAPLYLGSSDGWVEATWQVL